MREIHVTVSNSDVNRLSAAFRLRPLDFEGVKVHRFYNLAKARGAQSFVDVMTGEQCSGSLDEARQRCLDRVRVLGMFGVEALRWKIECPASEYPESDEEGYYESHAELEGVPALQHLPHDWRGIGVLLSRSLRSWSWHATMRSSGCGLERHRDRFSRATRMLLKHGVQIVTPPRHEYVEVDTLRSHDRVWETDGQEA